MAVGETYWQSFVFPDLSGFRYGLRVEVAGFAEDPDPSDNKRTVVVHLAAPTSSLPQTGTRPITVAITGLALIFAGAGAIWYGRRRRLIRPADRPYDPQADNVITASSHRSDG
jgi:LPXTG-motif cell wall-anchored protein